MADTASEGAQTETEFRPVSREAREARERDAFLRGDPLSDDETEAEAPDTTRHATDTKAAPKAPKAKAAVDPKPEPELEDEDLDDEDADDEDERVTASDDDDEVVEETDEDDDDEDEDAEVDEDEAPAKGKADPDRERRVAAVARQEARMRAQLATERQTMHAEFERKEAAIKPRIEKLEKFERVVERAGVDPLALLRHAGVTDMEYVGRLAWAEHQAATDPKHKEAAAKLQRDRERDDRLAQLEKAESDRKAADENREKTSKQEAEFKGLMSRIGKIATKTEDAPLTKTLLASNEKRAHALLAQAHLALWNKHGTEPSPRATVKLAEKMQSRQLRELGIDPKSLATTAAADTTDTKATTKPGGKKPAAIAKGKTNGKAAPAKPEDADLELSDDDLKKEIVRGMADLRGN